jgi:antagonist of KipI
MIQVVNPGWLSIVVDGGRFGYGDIGVPSSKALDDLAYAALNYLMACPRQAPVLEVMGSEFSLAFLVDVQCAITGAKVAAYMDDQPVEAWTVLEARKGSTLRVKEVTDGLRYYVGFSGIPASDRVMGSSSTNLECRFGGYRGRPLIKGDLIDIQEIRPVGPRSIPAALIPAMGPPHILRVIEGPESDFFVPESVKRFYESTGSSPYTVSTRFNRTGIRLQGRHLVFKKSKDRSIISEGIMPGTVQIPGDGLPIIVLHERTIGGYARLGTIAKVDHYRLAHLKPGDVVQFEGVTVERAETLRRHPAERLAFVS